MRMIRALFLALATAPGSLLPLANTAIAETTDVRIADQFGLSYLPVYVALDRGMFEQRFAAAGLTRTKVTELKIASGSAANDALLSGNADLVLGGLTGMFILSDKTRGTPLEVRGAIAISDSPIYLTTINPRIKSVSDLTDADRISMTAAKGTTHSFILELATAKKLGWDHRHKFDALAVGMRHPDATVALLNDREPRTHSSTVPFLFQELANPRVHIVYNSYDIVGGRQTLIVAYTTRKWKSENPKTYRATMAALTDAMTFIEKDPEGAAKVYVEHTNSKLEPEQVAQWLRQKDEKGRPVNYYSPVPTRALVLADYMYKDKLLSHQPRSWKDYFWENLYAQPGN
ncbi:MAG TPA: ABC transporter substrate-binding protein [Casimicrobiaceae bacterium]|nr:ABC transporter substrate-binding protein [Casimicrobiaceae bacterium]